MEWDTGLPLTKEEALEFATRWGRKRDKYPDKPPHEMYEETKLEMAFTKAQCAMMDIIMISFIKYMENKK